MFHKCKSGFNEYWSHNDGLFTLLKTVVAMDFYNFEALPGFIFCSEVTILWSICLLIFRMCPVCSLLTSGDSLSLPNSRVKQSKKRISWEMSVYKSQEHELLKLDNISSKKLYAVKLNIILMAVMARLKKFNYIYWKALCLGICYPGSCKRCTVVTCLYVVWSDWERYFE